MILNVINLLLPWPPSVNMMYRAWFTKGMKAPKMLLSKKARDYYAEVSGMLPEGIGDKRCSVHITLLPPTRQKRDIDNYVKPVFDTLSHIGAWDDDEQVEVLTVVKGPVTKGGRCIVCVNVNESWLERLKQVLSDNLEKLLKAQWK
jgi:crossover junction endodeoxyribonuclease RusA